MKLKQRQEKHSTEYTELVRDKFKNFKNWLGPSTRVIISAESRAKIFLSEFDPLRIPIEIRWRMETVVDRYRRELFIIWPMIFRLWIRNQNYIQPRVGLINGLIESWITIPIDMREQCFKLCLSSCPSLRGFKRKDLEQRSFSNGQLLPR